jgi:hypothetical protein
MNRCVSGASTTTVLPGFKDKGYARMIVRTAKSTAARPTYPTGCRGLCGPERKVIRL